MSQQPVMIVTGSSRGIGAATAIEAANRGYAVCINYRNNQAAAESVQETIRAAGGTCCIQKADVSDEKQVTLMFERVVEEFGEVTALVNNVGILKEKMPLVELEMARVEEILRVNVVSAFACCKEAVKRMAFSKGGRGGSIVNVSSAASRLGSPGEYVDYASSKGAMDTLTIGLSKEVASEGIRVNCVRPGFIHTDIHADGGEKDRVQRLASKLPLGRGGEPEEVAKAILWLISEDSSFVTGTFIDIAGGL